MPSYMVEVVSKTLRRRIVNAPDMSTAVQRAALQCNEIRQGFAVEVPDDEHFESVTVTLRDD